MNERKSEIPLLWTMGDALLNEMLTPSLACMEVES